MTPDELAALPLSAIEAERCRRSLAYFVRASWHVLEPETPMLWNWHHQAIADHIQGMLQDWDLKRQYPAKIVRAQNLVINVPPGSAKSRILSVCAPAWAWLRWPGWRVLCLSANPEVALRDSVYCRELVLSDWYNRLFAPEWTLADDQNAKGKFKNTQGGERSARGMTARITGSRADAIFVDDPNDAKEVYSETARRSVIDSWDSAIWNRVNDPMASIRVGIAQRLHEQDWSGHVLGGDNDGVGRWEHLCLPMEFEPAHRCRTNFDFADPRTVEGELLHEARFPREVLDAERVVLGSMGYAGQMQQRPAPAEGAMFKTTWWRFWGDPERSAWRPTGCYEGAAVPIPKRMDWTVISVDANFKKTEDGSRVSILVIGGCGADRYLLDNITKPMSFTETLHELIAVRDKYPKASRMLIEDKANGSAIIDVLRSRVSGVIGINPEGGKEARAAAIQPAVESHNVYLPDGAQWLDAFLGELNAFPLGKHDDQMDSLSQALNYMAAGAHITRARALNVL